MTADNLYMQMALEEARRAAEHDEVPVGAVIVKEGQVISRAFNRREMDNDATAHAEILAIRAGGQHLNNWHLDDCTIYVTLEPCPMCAGAIVLARINRLVYGAADPKTGAAGSLYNIVRDNRLNHQVLITAGVLAEDSAGLLREFFRERRVPRVGQ